MAKTSRRMRSRPPLVEVLWMDSSSTTGWKTVERVREWIEEGIYEALTVGFLLYEDRNEVVIAQTLSQKFFDPGEDDNWSSVDCMFRIPRKCIKRKTILRAGTVTWKG